MDGESVLHLYEALLAFDMTPPKSAAGWGLEEFFPPFVQSADLRVTGQQKKKIDVIVRWHQQSLHLHAHSNTPRNTGQQGLCICLENRTSFRPKSRSHGYYWNQHFSLCDNSGLPGTIHSMSSFPQYAQLKWQRENSQHYMELIQNTALSCLLDGLGRGEWMTEQKMQHRDCEKRQIPLFHVCKEEQRRYNCNRMTALQWTSSITPSDDLVAQRAKCRLHFRERWRGKEENREIWGKPNPQSRQFTQTKLKME